jgi:hypothetical protein
MTNHQCPKCELRFNWKTEVDDHCRHDHPEFRHEYPAVVAHPAAVGAPPVEAKPVEVRHAHIGASSLAAWLQPARRRAPDRHSPPH